MNLTLLLKLLAEARLAVPQVGVSQSELLHPPGLLLLLSPEPMKLLK